MRKEAAAELIARGQAVLGLDIMLRDLSISTQQARIGQSGLALILICCWCRRR